MTVSPAMDEPIWSVQRRESSGHLFWGSTTSKVKFRCEVEVLEYVKDPNEHRVDYLNDPRLEDRVSYSIMVCATCVAAVAVTVFLPWLLIGST